MEDSRLDSRTSPRPSLWPVPNCCPMMQSLASASLDFPANQSTPVGGHPAAHACKQQARVGVASIQRPSLRCHPCSALSSLSLSPRSLRFACAAARKRGKKREKGEKGEERKSGERGQREQGRGRKWVVTSATAAMEPSHF